MSKVITSPSEHWPGTVTIADPLTMPQLAAFEAGFRRVRQLGEGPALSEYFDAMLPGVYACIEAWDLKGWDAFSPDRFPTKPYKESALVAAWLIESIGDVRDLEEQEIPKASTEPPTPPPSEGTEASAKS